MSSYLPLIYKWEASELEGTLLNIVIIQWIEHSLYCEGGTLRGDKIFKSFLTKQYFFPILTEPFKRNSQFFSALNRVDSKICEWHIQARLYRQEPGRWEACVRVCTWLVCFWIYKESCDVNQIPIDTIPTVARACTSSNMVFCCGSVTFSQSVRLQALKIRHRINN